MTDKEGRLGSQSSFISAHRKYCTQPS